MQIPDDVLAELHSLGRRVQRFDEGGKPYLLIADHALPEGCDRRSSTSSLCPQGRDGYPSRLFFSQR